MEELKNDPRIEDVELTKHGYGSGDYLSWEYKGKSYKCILRGDDGEVTSYNHPKVKKNLNDNSDLKTPIRIGKNGWLCFLLFIVAGLLAVIIRVNHLSSVGVVIESVSLCPCCSSKQ